MSRTLHGEVRRRDKALWRHFTEGLRHFRLIAEGDHVLLGLSGGKDSLALLALLGQAARRSCGRWRVTALHVRIDSVRYESDTAYLEAQAAEAGVPLFVETIHVEPDRKARRSPCFLCAWQRRKVLFDTAQRLGCNKIAFGHHQDDILLTALMNLTYCGTFSTMPARLTMRKFPVTIIRPLCMVREDELRAYALDHALQPVSKVCVYDRVSTRTRVREVFDLQQRLNPEYRYSLWHALIKSGALVQEADGKDDGDGGLDGAEGAASVGPADVAEGTAV